MMGNLSLMLTVLQLLLFIHLQAPQCPPLLTLFVEHTKGIVPEFVYRSYSFSHPSFLPTSKMSPLPISTTPPPSHESYLLDQLAGERITLPGSKGVFRILASSAQTAGGIAVFTSGAVLSDAPGFHWHQEAHDVFLVTKGFLRLWNGDKCRVLGPGDFAYVPPVSIIFRLPL